jgi:uncharacterized protein
MNYIDPHCHMVSRTTDDYLAMARMGCVAVSEPAFWAGFDRGPQGFRDYFHHLTAVEPKRAAQFGIVHHSWICLNAKEADDLGLAREVLAFMPEFLDRPGVLGVGEIGLNKNTRNEAKVFLDQLDLAAAADRMVLVHTPHLEDKLMGTRMILDMFRRDARVPPERILIDHVEEHTIKLALDAGHWCAMTLYPTTKCTPARAADMVERYGAERLMVNSACDWGVSGPAVVRDFALEMKLRGHPEALVQRVIHDNPRAFFAQSAGWRLPEPEIAGAGSW